MKTLKVTAKCKDLFSATYMEDGEEIKTHDGYVPDFMPGNHYGDYVEIEIDVETGRIINWERPDREEIINDLNGK